MSSEAPSGESPARKGTVRTLPVGPGHRPAPRTRRSPGWLRWTFPALGLTVLLVVVIAGTGTVSSSTPPPFHVTVPGPAGPEEIPMWWDEHRLPDTRIMGITSARDLPIALASVGSGSPALVDPGTGQAHAIGGLSALASYSLTALIDDDTEVLVLGIDGSRAHLWRDPVPSVGRSGADHVSQTGLEDVEQIVGAAAAAGLRVLFGTDAAGRYHAWIDGGEGAWDRHEVGGLDGARLDLFTAIGGAFFAGGAHCDGDACLPAIWRSDDAVHWSAAANSTRTPGTVTGIVGSGDMLYAVGSMESGTGASWRSGDAGRTWVEEPAAGLSEAVALTVDAIDDSTLPRTADLNVNGEHVVVREGGALITPLGNISVAELGEAAVLKVGDETRTVAVGGSWEIHTHFDLEDLDAYADRLVAVGSRTRPGADSQALAWIRDVGSAPWRPSVLPGRARPENVRIGDARVQVVGAADGEAVVWSGTQRLPDAERAALGAVEDFLQGAAAGDPGLIRDVLASRLPEGDSLALPGLGGLGLNPWLESGQVDADAVSGIAEFVDGLGTSVATSNCLPLADFTDPATIRVTCGYETTSSLLESLGITRSDGTLLAVTRDGLVASTAVPAAGEADALSRLNAFIAAYGTQLDGIDGTDANALDAGRPDAGTAVAMLDAASFYRRLSFLPGESRLSDSPFGRLEVSWIEEPFGPTAASVTAIAWTGNAFVAATSDWVDPSRTTDLWSSPDGTVWDPLPGPDPDAWIEALAPTPDGRLIAWGHARSDFRLWEHSGAGWRELPIPSSNAAEMWMRDYAVNDAGALFLMGRWDRRRGTNGVSVLYVDAAGAARVVDLPPEARQGQISLAAAPGTFLLTARDDSIARVWSTATGEAWDLLAEQPMGEARWAIDLVRYEGRYVALTDVDWSYFCAGSGRGCRPPRDLWASQDGVAWEKIATAPSAASALIYEIRGGELGLVSPVRYGRAFLLIWMSTNGTDWAVPIAVLPRVEPSESWVTGATVGDSGFVIDTTQENWQEQPTVSLIVARQAGG